MNSTTVSSWAELPHGRFGGGEDAFILGAGFSRAISEAMPLTDELGNLCLEVLLDTSPSPLRESFSGGTFEGYLSELAGEQPYLSAADNLRNQALFADFSAAIGSVLSARQQEVLRRLAPEWLTQFLVTAHLSRSTVITFNYDTLLECLAATGALDAPSTIDYRGHVGWTELTGDIPSWAPGSMRISADPAETLRLLKLHGSLNWYWTPGDTTGSTIARRILPGTYGQPVAYVEEDRRRELPGRVPFIVPPTATKSSYYTTPLVRELWMQASDRILTASRLFFVGYSLPITDATVGNMLAPALKDPSRPIVIADLAPDGIRERLIRLGANPDSIAVIDPAAAQGPVSLLAAVHSEQLSAEAFGNLAGDARNPLLAVSWGNAAHAAVIGLTVDADAVVLEVEPAASTLLAALRRRSASDPRPIALNELVAARQGQGPLLVQDMSGARQPVISSGPFPMEVGETNSWHLFNATGSPTALDFPGPEKA